MDQYCGLFRRFPGTPRVSARIARSLLDPMETFHQFGPLASRPEPISSCLPRIAGVAEKRHG